MIHGKDKLAKILTRMDTQDSQQILSSITSQNNQLALGIKQLMFSFDEILQLHDADMQALHKRIQKEDLLLALKGASDEIKNKLFLGVSSRKKAMLIDELEFMGKVKKSDVLQARQRIMQTVYEMVQTGEISLDDEHIT